MKRLSFTKENFKALQKENEDLKKVIADMEQVLADDLNEAVKPTKPLKVKLVPKKQTKISWKKRIG